MLVFISCFFFPFSFGSHFFQGQHPPTAHPGKLTDPHPPHFWSTSKIFKAACHCRFCPKALIRLVAQRVAIVTVPSAHNRQEMWFLAVWCHSELVEISWKYKNMRRKGWALTSIKPISRGLISVDSLSEQLARNKKNIFSILCSIHTPNLTKRKKKPSTGLEMHSNFSTTFLLPSLWLHCETIYLFVQWNCIHWQLCVKKASNLRDSKHQEFQASNLWQYVTLSSPKRSGLIPAWLVWSWYITVVSIWTGGNCVSSRQFFIEGWEMEKTCCQMEVRKTTRQ